MGFDKIKWTYNPPPTVDQAPPTKEAVDAALSAPAAADPRNSNAAKLVNRLADLNAVAKYIESAVVARCANQGVKFDLSTDPALNQALQRIYGSAPAGMSVRMYNNLLDAEVGIARADIALRATGGPYTVDPIQRADLATVNNAFESAMLADGSFDNQIPLLLRPIKSDRVIFDSLTTAFNNYPVLQAPPASTGTLPGLTSPPPDTANPGTEPTVVIRHVPVPDRGSPPVDVNQDTADNVNERLDSWTGSYSDAYDLLATAPAAYSELDQFGTLSNQISSDLQALLATLQAMEVLCIKPTLKNIKNLITDLVITMLASELGGFLGTLDQQVQLYTEPVRDVMNTFGKIFNEIQYQANEAAFLLGEGIGLKNAAGGNYQPPTPAQQDQLNQLPKELAKFGAYLSYGTQAITLQMNRVEMSLMKMLDSKLQATQVNQKALSALKDAEAMVKILIAISQSVASVQQIAQTSLLGAVQAAEGATGTVMAGATQLLQQSGATQTPSLPPAPAPVRQTLGLQ